MSCAPTVHIASPALRNSQHTPGCCICMHGFEAYHEGYYYCHCQHQPGMWSSQQDCGPGSKRSSRRMSAAPKHATACECTACMRVEPHCFVQPSRQQMQPRTSLVHVMVHVMMSVLLHWHHQHTQL
jgi:hypothetical protein